MRLMLFRDGRYPRYAFPVLAEYIRPNVYPRKSNFPSGTLQIRVFSSLTVSFVGRARGYLRAGFPRGVALGTVCLHGLSLERGGGQPCTAYDNPNLIRVRRSPFWKL